MSHWWISPAGAITGPKPDSQDISYENNGYRGPYSSKAAAQAADGGQGSPGGSWYVVSVPGTAKVKVLQSGSQPPDIIAGPFATKAEAQAFANNLESHPVTPITGKVNVGVTSGLSNFFHALTEKNTWIRVAEVILGAALLLIGLAKLAGNTQVGKAAKGIATKAALI